MNRQRSLVQIVGESGREWESQDGDVQNSIQEKKNLEVYVTAKPPFFMYRILHNPILCFPFSSRFSYNLYWGYHLTF